MDGKAIGKPCSIRSDMAVFIRNLLTLGEDVFALWAQDHVQVPDVMRLAVIPEDKRNSLCPIKWTVTLSQKIEDSLAKAESKKKSS